MHWARERATLKQEIRVTFVSVHPPSTNHRFNNFDVMRSNSS
jgi:hypothetical protein